MLSFYSHTPHRACRVDKYTCVCETMGLKVLTERLISGKGDKREAKCECRVFTRTWRRKGQALSRTGGGWCMGGDSDDENRHEPHEAPSQCRSPLRYVQQSTYPHTHTHMHRCKRADKHAILTLLYKLCKEDKMQNFHKWVWNKKWSVDYFLFLICDDCTPSSGDTFYGSRS